MFFKYEAQFNVLLFLIISLSCCMAHKQHHKQHQQYKQLDHIHHNFISEYDQKLQREGHHQIKRNKFSTNFVDKFGVHRTMFDFNEADSGKALVTNLDNLRGLFVLVRQITLRQAERNMKSLYRRNRASGKMQRRLLPNEPFPCNLSNINTRSPEPPTSVHRLRPGDIDAVASFGDSLSAGNGEISENILHIINEFRGISFAGGGHKDWRTFLTLPNILKVFNPNVYGYSTSNSGLTVDRSSHLNIAEPMIMSRDLPFQARILIDRMRKDPKVDMKRHWKLLTIFVGNNDICSDMCHHENINEFLERHEDDMRRTLTILRDNVPRMLVNVVPAPNMVVSLYPMTGKPLSCSAVHHVGCHCIFNERMTDFKLQAASQNINRWQHVDEYVASLPEFQTEDFAVVYQPYTANVTTPNLPDGRTDLRYFASDCFHFSQLGHAAMANVLWNNMLQPIGQKQVVMPKPFEHFECPTAERPYIATMINSKLSGL